MSGNNVLAHRSLPLPEGGAFLRIAQRMRLEASQLEGVARRMTVSILSTFIAPSQTTLNLIYPYLSKLSKTKFYKMSGQYWEFKGFFFSRLKMNTAFCWHCLVDWTKRMFTTRPMLLKLVSSLTCKQNKLLELSMSRTQAQIRLVLSRMKITVPVIIMCSTVSWKKIAWQDADVSSAS